MKRVRGTAAKKTSRPATGRASRKPADLGSVREEIKNLVGNAAAEMVQNGIAEANKGHYAAMKFLFELVGLYPPAEGATESTEGNGLAQTLLRRLGVAEAVTNDCAAEPTAGVMP